MNRRDFIYRMMIGLGYGMGIGLFSRPLSAATKSEREVPPLHYRPLNGRTLRELARRRLHHGGDQFVSPVGIGREGRLWQVMSWKLFHKNEFRKDLRDEKVIPVEVDWEAVRQHRELSVTFLKHASLLIKDRGRYLLVDPVFNDIFWFIKDFSPLQTEGMPAADEILITHGHYDHLDTVSLGSIPADRHVITPLGYKDEFDSLKMKNRSQLDWYNSIRSGGAEITLLPCNH